MADEHIERFVEALLGHAGRGHPLPAEITEPERAMVAYAVALTRTPGAMRRDHLEPMRAAGMSDRAILEVNQVVSYFAYANRVVDGLGVELE
jgi:uncharacterized peroxidase-related enzyme